MSIIGVVLLVIVIILAAGTIIRATFFRSKKKKIQLYGQMVQVQDGRMHVYSVGEGEKKIVLLPGLGTPLPSADFAPLMRALSKSHTAICVEYFGVGFSSETSLPRTCKAYVEETRAALTGAGFSPPYLLMPHSLSSIYSEYYAAKYPEEVEAIISLDGTSSAFYEKIPAFVRGLLPMVKYLQVIGMTSILPFLITNRKKPMAYGSTRKEIEDAIIHAGFSINNTFIEQLLQSSEHVKEVMDIPYPSVVPYLKIIAKTTYETPVKQLKMSPQEYQRKHLERLGPHAQHEILDGNHFIHANNATTIAEITDRFLAKRNIDIHENN